MMQHIQTVNFKDTIIIIIDYIFMTKDLLTLKQRSRKLFYKAKYNRSNISLVKIQIDDTIKTQ